jgi:uncharacterized protein YndB with AHSA1/START domain
MGRVAITVEYPHLPEKVWRALTEPDLIAQWLMKNDFAPKVGHRFTFRTDPAPGFDGIVHCEVLELIAPRKLSFSWRGGPLDTVATFELSPTATGTQLRFTQTGFRGFKANLVRLLFMSRGYRSMYRRLLPGVLERLDSGGRERQSTESAGCDEPGWFWRLVMKALVPIFGPVRKRPR